MLVTTQCGDRIGEVLVAVGCVCAAGFVAVYDEGGLGDGRFRAVDVDALAAAADFDEGLGSQVGSVGNLQ